MVHLSLINHTIFPCSLSISRPVSTGSHLSLCIWCIPCYADRILFPKGPLSPRSAVFKFGSIISSYYLWLPMSTLITLFSDCLYIFLQHFTRQLQKPTYLILSSTKVFHPSFSLCMPPKKIKDPNGKYSTFMFLFTVVHKSIYSRIFTFLNPSQNIITK